MCTWTLTRGFFTSGLWVKGSNDEALEIMIWSSDCIFPHTEIIHGTYDLNLLLNVVQGVQNWFYDLVFLFVKSYIMLSGANAYSLIFGLNLFWRKK